jgi:hypothetical protein
MMKCGKARCASASDASKRHGPYYELIYKAGARRTAHKRGCREEPHPMARR